MSDDTQIRYSAGGVPYVNQPVQKKEVVAPVVKTKPNKKKKKKVIQEIMGDDLKESKEMLDEII